MATGKITKDTVDAVPVPPTGKRNHLWDETLKGFGLMVTHNGVRSYLIQYRIGGRGNPTRRVTIGKHGSPWTPKTARDRAADLLHQVRCKVDPFDAEKDLISAAKQRKADQAAQKIIETKLAFDKIGRDYIDKRAKATIKTWKEYESIFDRDLKPALGSSPITTISPADIVDLLDKVGERGPTASLRAYNVLRAIFSFAAEKHKRYFKAANSPMLDISRPGTVVKRERHLSDYELRFVWQAAGGLGWPYCEIIRLLILTGQRLREVAHVPWPELDLTERTWIIPGSRTKNGEATLVPLNDGALKIYTETAKIKNKADLVFLSSSNTAITAFSKMKKRLDGMTLALMRKDAEEAGGDPIDITMQDWRLHDLRRTATVGMQKLGIQREVIEEVLNHKTGSRDGIVGVYQVYRFQAEKAAALAAWDQRVTAIVDGKPMPSNVIEIAERRA